MSFKSVVKQMMHGEDLSEEEASKRLAGHTYKLMKKHGMSTKHGIPKGLFKKYLKGD